MNTCICCHNALLRHFRHHEIYWFCPHCRQEMPSADSAISCHLFAEQVEQAVQEVLEPVSV